MAQDNKPHNLFNGKLLKKVDQKLYRMHHGKTHATKIDLAIKKPIDAISEQGLRGINAFLSNLIIKILCMHEKDT